MNPQLNIRRANPSDALTIAEFNLLLAAETEDLRLDPARVRAGVDALLHNPAKGVYFVAEAAGVLAGQVMITREWSDWRNGNFWWVQSVYVKPEFRRAGVFRALFAHIKKQAAAHPDVCGLRLYVHSGNIRAHESYAKLGMERTKYEVFEMNLRE